MTTVPIAFVRIDGGRRSLRVIGVVLGVLLLSGCVRAETAITVHSDDTVDLAMVVAVSDEVMQAAGMSAEDVRAQMQLQAVTPIGPEVKVITEDYADDGYTGSRISATGLALSEVNNDGEDFSLVRDGDVFRFSATVTYEEEAVGDLGLTGMPGFGTGDEPDVRISITFPGEVLESNGVTEGNTVTWTGVTQTDLMAVGSATGSGLPVLSLALAAVGVAVVAAVALVLFRRRGATTAGVVAAHAGPYPVPMAPMAAYPPIDAGPGSVTDSDAGRQPYPQQGHGDPGQGEPGYGVPGEQPGYPQQGYGDPGQGWPGYGVPGEQPGFAPVPGQPGYGVSGEQPGFAPVPGQPGHGVPGEQPAYPQQGYGDPGQGWPGYGVPGEQPAYPQQGYGDPGQGRPDGGRQ